MTNADRSALLEAFTAAWEAKDVDGLMRLMADECAFRASVGPEPGVTFSGRDEVRRGFEQFLGAVAGPPPETETEAALVAEHFAVTRWTNRFPQSDGPPVVVRACDVFEFAGDRISFKDTYRKVAG
jgi:ketosteroid isomerase-like protein